MCLAMFVGRPEPLRVTLWMPDSALLTFEADRMESCFSRIVVLTSRGRMGSEYDQEYPSLDDHLIRTGFPRLLVLENSAAKTACLCGVWFPRYEDVARRTASSTPWIRSHLGGQSDPGAVVVVCPGLLTSV
jgi:hypothetical protein